MRDEFDYKFDLLKLEITTIQEVIRNYDTILFTIKGWTITLFSAAIFFIAQTRQPLYLVFCAVAIVLFWFVDAAFKATQRTFISRYRTIEQFLQSDKFALAVSSRSLSDLKIPHLGAEMPTTSSGWLRLSLRMAVSGQIYVIYIGMLVLTLLAGLIFVVSP